MQKKDIILVFTITASILMLPLIGMQVSDEVDWGLHDFVVMGILISGTGLSIAHVARKMKNTHRRAAAIIALVLLLILIWLELAVGVFGSPVAGS